jgi:hypothetical protein
MKKALCIFLAIAILAAAIPVLAGGRYHSGGAHYRHDGHRRGGNDPLPIVAGTLLLGGLVVLDRVLNSRVYVSPAPVYVAPDPVCDPYAQAYQQEAQRIQQQRHWEWERYQRERGAEAARRDYGSYGYGR